MSAGECHLCGVTWTGDDNTDSAAHCDAVRYLKAALARVTAERDEARRKAEIRLNAIESMRRAALRATPTEAE